MFTASNKKGKASLHNNSVGSRAVGGSNYLINTGVTGMNWHFLGHTFVSQPILISDNTASMLIFISMVLTLLSPSTLFFIFYKRKYIFLSTGRVSRLFYKVNKKKEPA